MPSISFAGIVKGKIIEQGTNEPLTGATIVANDGQGTSADIDGNYSLKLQNGTYTLTVRFIGFKTMIKDTAPQHRCIHHSRAERGTRHNDGRERAAHQTDTGQGCR